MFSIRFDQDHYYLLYILKKTEKISTLKHFQGYIICADETIILNLYLMYCSKQMAINSCINSKTSKQY